MLGIMSYTHTSLYCRSGRRGMRVLVTALLLGIAPALHGQEVDWRANGRDVQGTRYSPDSEIKRDVSYGDFASRGVSTWLDESAPAGAVCRRRIFVATAQSQLFALDSRDGRSCAGFGRSGMVDLKAGLRIPPFEPGAYSMTSPPVVVNGLVITGSSIADNSRPNPASGEVRAYDARTGAIRWTWDPIPQDPKDPAFREWRGAMA